MVINYKTESPITLENGIKVATGLETYVGVSRTFKTKQPSPYSDCIQSLEPFSNYSMTLFGYFAQFNITKYDQELCFSFCYQDLLLSQCGCCSQLTPNFENTTYCVYEADFECETNFTRMFVSSDTNKLCGYVCREQCESQKFTFTTHLARYPSQSYVNFLKLYDDKKEGRRWFPNTTDVNQLNDFAEQSMLRLIVNYDSHSYTTITELPAISLDVLVSGIGGNLGLFLGISLLSIVELLEFALDLFTLAFNHWFKKDQVQPFVESA